MYTASVEETDVVKECISSGKREHDHKDIEDLEFVSCLEPWVL